MSVIFSVGKALDHPILVASTKEPIPLEHFRLHRKQTAKSEKATKDFLKPLEFVLKRY